MVHFYLALLVHFRSALNSSVALQSDSTLTVNASGASTNNGTINLGSAGKMVVAAGVELTNGKDAVINIGTK